MALPQLGEMAGRVACVPGHYLTHGVLARFEYLRQLQQRGRLLIMLNLPRGAAGWRCIWLVIFRTVQDRLDLMAPEAWGGGGDLSL